MRLSPRSVGFMRFAKIVFLVAGVWGLLIVTPLYFIFDFVGRSYPPPITHPDFYYGFVGVTLAWQIAFLIIATNPARYRPFILAAILEKFIYGATLGTLYLKGQLELGQLAVVSPDFILGLLFVASFLKTADQE
jgi:hypothetical protein